MLSNRGETLAVVVAFRVEVMSDTFVSRCPAVLGKQLSVQLTRDRCSHGAAAMEAAWRR